MLKVPPANGEPNDSDYDYRVMNPTAFTMFVPTEDKLPDGVPAPFPSLCVRFLEGENDLAANKGTIGIQFLLSTWSAGIHGADQFRRTWDGWRDVWNFADIAVRAIEQTTNISGYEIDQTIPVKFGPLTEQEAVPDYYPFWYAWVTFQLTYPLRRNTADIQEFL
jgi:hypothetical protein